MTNVPQWRCICGRRLRKMKCMKCGDRLPRWIEEGKITMALRTRMDTQTYKKWHEEALVDRDVANALRNIQGWLDPKRKKKARPVRKVTP